MNALTLRGDAGASSVMLPSLRAKALHAVSIDSDGQLMLFNNGLGSLNQPAGTAAGETRGYSAVSAYAIDPVALTAQEVWNFDYGKSLYSSVCSSAYEAGGKSLLLNYAYTDAGATAHVVGLDANHAVVFDIRYDSPVGCGASWNAVPVPFERLSFQ